MNYSISVILVALMVCQVYGGATELTRDNIDGILEHNEVVFLNFYADWCRFSQMLKPTFEEAANKIGEEFPPEQGKVLFVKVNCDVQPEIAQKYFVNKYPTLKLVRNGELVKKEYRGQRSVEALVQFIKDQIKSTVAEVASSDDLDNLDENKRHIIGYFNEASGPAYENFKKISSLLKDDCQFTGLFGEASIKERANGDNIVYRAPRTHNEDLQYLANLGDYDMLLRWTTDKCVPVVREITFENAEELTEEGLPFLILFHKPDDTEIVDLFSKTVASHLMAHKSSINFLTADGLKFSHPLHHLGKSTNDLPVIAIDSFRHMYVFPKDIKESLANPAVISQFIADLHSGKLHREFHHGPDPTTSPAQQVKADEKNDDEDDYDDNSDDQIGEEKKEGDSTPHVPNDQDKTEEEEEVKKPTSPPESLFKKLQPSNSRYTILKDEL
ncbi:unnamed protein product [Owenia fusiformis]|uniref:Uncharacterized protein n=1 Tax=Owenia fusiformis TaxID=6347 RepID=A0A8J1UKL7_OWEFU|nr:unnamed protein product [Owenia fusiformis]